MKGFADSIKTDRRLGIAFAVVLISALCATPVFAASQSANQIRDVRVWKKGNKTVVTVTGSRRPSYTAFRLKSPKRLVIDIADSQIRGVPSLIDHKTGIINGVAVSEYSVKGVSICRVMINFREEVAYRVRVNGNKLVASLTGAPKAPSSANTASVATAQDDMKRVRAEVKAAQAQAKADMAKARQAAEAARDLEQRAKTEIAKARKEAHTATKAKIAAEAELNRAKADMAEVRKAAEAAKHLGARAKKEIAKARKEADIATKAKATAEAELSRLKKESAKRRIEAEQAKRNAEKALVLLKKEKKIQQSSEQLHRTAATKQTELAAKQIAAYREKVEKAEALMKAERLRRESMELKLTALNGQLDEAKEAKKRAQHALAQAEERAVKLKREAVQREQAAEQAARAAKTALVAQTKAAKDYEKATKGEREKLLRVLKEKEKSATAASNRLKTIEEEKDTIHKALAAARKKLRQTIKASQRASEQQATIENRTEQALTKAEKKRQEAEQAARIAKDQIAKALLAKQQAEAEIVQIQAAAQKDRKTAELRSKKRIAAAQKNADIAKKAKEEALAALQSADGQVLEMSKKVAGAEALAKDLKQALSKAKAKATQAHKKATALQETLTQATKRASLAEKRVGKMEKELSRVREQARMAKTRADRTEEALAKTSAAFAKEKERAKHIEKQLSQKNAAFVSEQQRALQMEEKLARVSEKAAVSEKRAEKYEKELAHANQRLSTEHGKESQSSSKSEEKKLSQEELRLLRLAKMQGREVDAKVISPPANGNTSDATKTAHTIEDIRFATDGSAQKVIIALNGPFAYNTTSDASGNAIMTFKTATLAPRLERTLDVTDFGGVIGNVSSYRDGKGTRIEVAVERTAQNAIERNDNTIEWIFKPTQAAALPASAAPALPKGTKTRTVAKEDQRAYAYPFERTAGYTTSTGSLGTKKKKKRYTGRHIDLDFKDADIQNILRLLSDVGHVNIITGDDVTGTVTIRMRDVAWDHALEVILNAKRLGMVREGNLIRVAPLDTLEKEREMEIARRKQKIALEPIETRLIPVSYATAAELKPRAADLLTERGTLSVDERTNVIIARDTNGALNQIEALIRNLDTQTPQVLIESRIVEAASIYAREIGIQWGGDFSAGAATGNPTGLAFPSSIGVAGGATDNKTPIAGLTTVPSAQPNPNFGVNLPAAVGTGSGGALGITLGSIANNANLSLRLSALEETGTLRILSSPKILTLDNREAHIEQGTLIPYSQISAQGIQTAFKEAKLNLTVTPHVTADGSVLLQLKVMRDEPDFNNTGARGDPTILKREAETELLVSDGHTAVIGGIFTRNHGTSYKKVPFLADIPILGWLFKSRSDSDRRSEMLIFITPRIVNRAESIGQ